MRSLLWRQPLHTVYSKGARVCTCVSVVCDGFDDVLRVEVFEGKDQQFRVHVNFAGVYVNRRLPLFYAERRDGSPSGPGCELRKMEVIAMLGTNLNKGLVKIIQWARNLFLLTTASIAPVTSSSWKRNKANIWNIINTLEELYSSHEPSDFLNNFITWPRGWEPLNHLFKSLLWHWGISKRKVQ